MIRADGNRLRVSGPIVLGNHVELRERSVRYFGACDIDVDLAGATAVDSSALALVFFWQRHAGAHRVTLLSVPPSLLALADLYGVGDLLGVQAETPHGE